MSLSWAPFEIVAAGVSTGKGVDHFNKPITIQVNYKDEDLLSGSAEDLMLYYYDDVTRDWYPMPTTVDTVNHKLTAQSDHLTVFDYKAASWQANSLPTVDGYKVSNFNGAGTYTLPIWTPPGPAGLQPSLALTYNSQVIDESTAYAQASWVGMGWSLDTGSIVLNMHETNSNTADDTYVITMNGISGQLLPVSVNGTVTTYKTANESFNKIEQNTSTKTWKVWDHSGTIYSFDTAIKTNATSGCVTSASSLTLPWAWQISKITDLNGNEINYTYEVQ